MADDRKTGDQHPATGAQDESVVLEDSFHNAFLYFTEALGVLSLDAHSQCQAMGNFNVAWEIQHDALDWGTALMNFPVCYLYPSEKEAIAPLLKSLQELPQEALAGNDRLAMNHQAWTPLRSAAVCLIARLDDAIRRNREFFRTEGR